MRRGITINYHRTALQAPCPLIRRLFDQHGNNKKVHARIKVEPPGHDLLRRGKPVSFRTTLERAFISKHVSSFVSAACRLSFLGPQSTHHLLACSSPSLSVHTLPDSLMGMISLPSRLASLRRLPLPPRTLTSTAFSPFRSRRGTAS